jgi:hypothetical protein
MQRASDELPATAGFYARRPPYCARQEPGELGANRLGLRVADRQRQLAHAAFDLGL